MKKHLFWRLFIMIALGIMTFFSLLHSAAILSNEKMSYIHLDHQLEILAWGEKARVMLEKGEKQKLNDWLSALTVEENTWVSIVRSDVDVVAGEALNERFWSGHGIGRNVEWKIHLDFHLNPIMEVVLAPSDNRFLIVLPDRMRPGTYQSYAFWVFRAVIPFIVLFALTLYIYRQVMTPLMHLHKASTEFSCGNYQARVVIDRDDEFGNVAKTFNVMAERTHSLIEYNRNLIADMSHEIRTPITRVEIALDCVEQGLHVDQMADRIRSDIKLMRQLCEDALTLAWLENEQPDLRSECFDLCELLGVLVEDAEFEYPDRTIDLNMPESLLLSRSNQRALGSALENIIRNGLRYTAEGESIQIRVWKASQKIYVSIIDSGPGIEASMCEKIFIPFFKANNQTCSRKGVGVGLALAKRHIEAIKGEVSAKNNHSGGLQFVVVLPLYNQ
ncbi:MAG: two-component system sensor histidine kinase PfeS [Psychromonas sp.]|jgi:two-component system sensor histidine kinase PfeS